MFLSVGHSLSLSFSLLREVFINVFGIETILNSRYNRNQHVLAKLLKKKKKNTKTETICDNTTIVAHYLSENEWNNADREWVRESNREKKSMWRIWIEWYSDLLLYLRLPLEMMIRRGIWTAKHC